MGVRCDNPCPHDFMNTVRCVSLVVDTATLVEPRYLWVHLSWTCRVSRVTRLKCLVRSLGAVVFAITSTFTTAPNGVDMLRSRVEILSNFEPHQGTRMGVPMCLNVLNFSLRASWLSGSHVVFETKVARTFINGTVRTYISHLTAHMCESV